VEGPLDLVNHADLTSRPGAIHLVPQFESARQMSRIPVEKSLFEVSSLAPIVHRDKHYFLSHFFSVC
jgi:hypothetical protein